MGLTERISHKPRRVGGSSFALPLSETRLHWQCKCELSLELCVEGLFVFGHAGDANEAFKQLPGAQDSDSFGRAQKVLKLTVGASCRPLPTLTHASHLKDVKLAIFGPLLHSHQIHNTRPICMAAVLLWTAMLWYTAMKLSLHESRVCRLSGTVYVLVFCRLVLLSSGALLHGQCFFTPLYA